MAIALGLFFASKENSDYSACFENEFERVRSYDMLESITGD